jgi:hypothetical protein
VLVGDARGLELVGELLVEDLLEQVLEAAVVGFLRIVFLVDR